MLPYALAIFSGAFLLFQVQPLIGKYILPWFGGGPGVWTTCLLFFQVVLLGGYAYAHLLSTRLRPRTQAIVHGVLLVAAMLMLPIAPSADWKLHVGGNPTAHILLLLAGTIGVPYFVLSATGPLLQQWFSVRHPGIAPYRLYALSNVGSLLALLSYPVFFEVKFARLTQANLWSAGFVVYVAFCGYCIWLRSRVRVDETESVTAAAEEAPTPSRVDRTLWIALPATASVLLLATTNKLCQDVAVIPFLWVLPLALYLLSFVICFDHARWYRRGVFAALLAIAIVVGFQLLAGGNQAPLWVQVSGYSFALFVACMFCHGETYRLKPAPRHLTSFYLALAAGGALGGLLVAVLAPAVFSDYRELPLGFWILSYLAGVVCFRHLSRSLAFGAGAGLMVSTFVLPWVRSRFDDQLTFGDEWLDLYRHFAPLLMLGLVVFLVSTLDFRSRSLLREWRPRVGGFVMFLSVAVGMTVIMQWRGTHRSAPIEASRNFYGTLKVYERNADDPVTHYYQLVHGATTHGLQFTAPERATWHTTYYGAKSGVGLAINQLPVLPGQRRIGLVGLGTGTLASYGARGDYFRIYDINPAVVNLARNRFTYLARCPANVDIVLGDARLSMEREVAGGQSQQFDLLALDAFSSDAIPVHLLTKESFALYLKQLKPGGVLAVHTSNRYLRLGPVVHRLADAFGLTAVTVYDDNEPEWWVYRTTWVLVTANHELLDAPEIVAATGWESMTHAPLWTDDHTSLFEVLR
jgi:SAM-dependent methyltransferase